MENISAYCKNISSAKKRRASAPGAVGQGPDRSRLLVTATSEAADETPPRDLPSSLGVSRRGAQGTPTQLYVNYSI